MCIALIILIATTYVPSYKIGTWPQLCRAKMAVPLMEALIIQLNLSTPDTLGTAYSVLIKEGVLISGVVLYTFYIPVTGTVHGVQIKGVVIPGVSIWCNSVEKKMQSNNPNPNPNLNTKASEAYLVRHTATYSGPLISSLIEPIHGYDHKCITHLALEYCCELFHGIVDQSDYSNSTYTVVSRASAHSWIRTHVLNILGVTVAAYIRMYGIYVLGKCPCGQKQRAILKHPWALTQDSNILLILITLSPAMYMLLQGLT